MKPSGPASNRLSEGGRGRAGRRGRGPGVAAAAGAAVVAGAGAAWVLGVALASADGAVAAAGAPRPGAARFVNFAPQAGLTLRNVCGELDKTLIVETVGNGACLSDVDDDGLIDIFLPNGSRLRPFPPGEAPRAALYRNRGGLAFEDVTSQAGVASPGYWGQGCAFGDYDDDGRVDLLVTGFGHYILYHNEGGLRFRDATTGSGLTGRDMSTAAAFGDYDGDGRIDLYVSHYVDYDPKGPPLPNPGSAPNCFYRGFPVICGPGGLKHSLGHLYHNEGGGKFRDVTKTSGMITVPSGYGLGVVWSDLDLDGDLDLYVANDSTRNFLYRNDGGGRFTEIGTIAGVAYNEEGRAQASMGVDAADYDNDGRPDLFVTNFSHDYSTLYHNEGGMFFLDVALSSGIGTATLPTLGWGTGFFDYDNDGWRDLFIANGHVFPMIDKFVAGTTWKQRNQLFHNEADGRFREVTGEAGPGFQEMHSARGAAFGDLDNDGDIDIVVNNIDETPSLLRNDSPSSNHWIGFRLIGARRNRGAIGARVTITAGGRRQMSETHAGSSHLCSNDPRLRFGLGSAGQVDRVEIRWPRGRVTTLGALPADRYHTIQEPTGPQSRPRGPRDERGPA